MYGTVKTEIRFLPKSYLAMPEVPAFLTGFLINFFLYIGLRIIGVKFVLNLLGPFVLAFVLLGIAIGVLLHARLRPTTFLRLEPFLFVVILSYFLFFVFNYHLSTTYLIPVNGFSMNRPEHFELHLVAEILIFLLTPCLFVLPGYYFADCYYQTDRPYVTYAAHLFGFLCGGLTGYGITLSIGPSAGFFGGFLLLLSFMFLRRVILGLVLLVLAVCIYIFSFYTPHLFFTWSVTDYKILNSCWSPYFKLDFISFDDDHCIAGIYNNLFLYYSCDTPEKAHLQVRQIYRELAKGKEKILVFGGALGTAMSYMAVFQDEMKQGVSVEVDPVVARLSTHEYAHYSGYALNRPDMEVVAEEGRAFLERDSREYDLIFLDGLDNRLFFAPLGYIAIENYVFTREGLSEVFEHLSHKGILTIDLGGPTYVESLAHFLASFPNDVKYKLFWYVVPDRPMVGLALYFIVASRDPVSLEKAAAHVRMLPSMVSIEAPDTTGVTPPTDNRPSLPYLVLEWSFNAATVGVIGLVGFALLRWRRGRLTTKTKDLGGGESKAVHFPIFAFCTLGFAYIFTEFTVVIRNARLFTGPALGMALLTAVFMMGGFGVNCAYVWIQYLKGKWRKRLALLGILTAICAMAMTVSGRVGSGSEAMVIAFLAGAGCGYLWPFFIQAHSEADRRVAYGLDTLGCMAGSFVFHFQFTNYGFYHVTVIACMGLMALSVYILLRMSKGGSWFGAASTKRRRAYL